eukprot:360476-Chlamydomonas_euryale.AAC.3
MLRKHTHPLSHPPACPPFLPRQVERILEYDSFEEEAPALITNARPPPGWPSKGAISVQDIVVRYRAGLEPALKGLSFDVAARQKVWVCPGGAKHMGLQPAGPHVEPVFEVAQLRHGGPLEDVVVWGGGGKGL